MSTTLYVCMHVRMYLCMYIYVGMHVCMWVCILYVYVCVGMYVCMCVCRSVCICVSMYTVYYIYYRTYVPGRLEKTLQHVHNENSLCLLVVGLVNKHGVSTSADLQLHELDQVGCSIRNNMTPVITSVS